MSGAAIKSGGVMTTFWHGGVRPANGRLTPQTASRRGEAGDGWVYVTTDRDLAATYAATLSGSWVMQVEPIGDVEPDPGSMLPYSYRCRSAQVLRSYTLSRTEREARELAVPGAPRPRKET